MTLLEAIRARRSVRTFEPGALDPEFRSALLAYAKKIENPYGIPIEWYCLDAGGDLSSPVIVGESAYLAGKMKKVPHAEEAFGYAFEKLLLYAQTLGFGGVWIAGTLDRSAFEKAVGLAEGEVMPCVSPIGKPANKMSLRESVMRKGIGADKRKPQKELFFEGSFETPYALGSEGPLSDALEAVRVAPSAVNKQPWRAVVDGCRVHFYEKQSGGYEKNGWDLQKIDLGIALCHFEIALDEAKVKYRFELSDPKIACPEDVRYIASYILS